MISFITDNLGKGEVKVTSDNPLSAIEAKV